MSNPEIKNATIISTMLGKEDHGIKSAFVNLDYGGSFQSFGGWVLGGAFTDQFIFGVLKAVGAESWEKLPGMPCRVRSEHTKVHAIGHYLKDQWFEPKVEFEKHETSPITDAAQPVDTG